MQHIHHIHPDDPHLEIDCDPGRLNFDVIHTYLSEVAYWSPGIPRTTVEKAAAGSLVFGLYHTGHQIGYARVVTDRATYAWLCDVFILPEYQGHGLGKWLIGTLLTHPDLQGLRNFSLGTRDAHGLYAQFGFTPLAEPARFMQIRRPDIYRQKSDG